MRISLLRIPTRIAAVALAALIGACALSFVIQHRGFYVTDTQQVLQGVASLDACAQHGIFKACELPSRPVGPFPPAQYLVGLAAKRLGASYDTALNTLVDLNAIAVVGTILLLGFAAVRLLSRRLALVLVVLGVTGPLAWYAQSGYGEPLAAFLTLAAIAAIALEAPAPVVVAAVFLAGLTKEPAGIFLVLLSSVIILARRGRLAALLPVAAAALAAVAVDDAFNFWRYGTLYNQFYSEPEYVTPGIGLKAQFMAGELVAPNAGLLWFWPLALVLLALSLATGLRERALRPAALAFGATIVGLLGLFAAYHNPFGWNALGPRYLVPWIPALSLAGAYLAREQLERVLDWLAAHALSAAAAAAVVAVLALPQMGFFVKPFAAYDLFGYYGPPCNYPARMALPAYEQPNYESCVTHLAWAARPVLLDGIAPLRTVLGLALSTLVVVATGATAVAATHRRVEA